MEVSSAPDLRGIGRGETGRGQGVRSVAAFDSASNAELDDAMCQMAALEAVARSQKLAPIRELDAREALREDGAKSMVEWLVLRLTISWRSATELVEVATRTTELLVITEAASRGEISSDQQVVLSRLASAASDAMWAKAAAGLSVRQLEVAARRQAITTKGPPGHHDQGRVGGGKPPSGASYALERGSRFASLTRAAVSWSPTHRRSGPR
jgi:hypothetical protein